MNNNQVSGAVVDAAMKVHSALGPGLLESAYAICLTHELVKRGYRVNREVLLPVVYDGLKLEAGYRLDMLVEERAQRNTEDEQQRNKRRGCCCGDEGSFGAWAWFARECLC